jgi:hypothetical protein
MMMRLSLLSLAVVLLVAGLTGEAQARPKQKRATSEQAMPGFFTFVGFFGTVGIRQSTDDECK